ncbi:LysR family transcriptional regulator [Oenococcus oeni]|uniref:LysR family transcriptional regulator n=1 Tax=Oenococcus oeni TaxID=1247 RepID=UPI0005102A07|nr:LysR family transcriptional regulator [Oenococcus oeni]KGH90980.1 LysR family transcriptional regulator [Oenococcus oeni IOEB_L26_1]
MTFEQLLYAVELANHQTLQETADLLHISKSGLSQSISQLENELGVKLFKRTRYGSKLTAQGKELLPLIKQMLSQGVSLTKKTHNLGKSGQIETVRVAYANTMLKPFLNEYLAMYQDVPTKFNMEISQETVTQIIDGIRSHRINLGFIAINDSNKAEIHGLEFKPVHVGHLKLFLSPDNQLVKKQKINIEDLQKQRFALFNDPYNDRIFEHLQYLCGPLKTVIKTDDGWAMYTTIKKANAVALVRDWQTSYSSYEPLQKLPSLDISNLIDDRFYLGWLTNPKYTTSRYTHRYTQEFIKHVDAQIKEC